MLRNAFTVLVDADVAEADAVVIRLRPRYGPPVTGRIVTGALAGLLATVPMSAAMLLMYRLLPGEERYPLPPHQITVEMAERADQEQLVDEPAEAAVATGAAHFGYGAAVGSLYALTAARMPLLPVAKGAAFGLFVWAGSYLGWLPAVDLLPPATEHPPRRTLLMILAHLVYGASLGVLVARLGGDASRRPRR